MKRWGTHMTIGIASAGFALVLAGTVGWSLSKPPTAGCSAETPASHKVHEIRATKVVVRPWLGQHHVYGIFIVPNQYKHNKRYAVALAVRGFDCYFIGDERSGRQYGDVAFAEPGHYLLRSYVPTREALWFLANGLFGDLRNPRNWTLVFIERSS